MVLAAEDSVSLTGFALGSDVDIDFTQIIVESEIGNSAYKTTKELTYIGAYVMQWRLRRQH